MNPVPELVPMLKKLHLPGLIDSLDSRNREAIERKLAYTEFLALLISDEVARRDRNVLTQRLRRAGFRQEKTLETFDFSRLPHVNRALFAELATMNFVREPANLLLVGPCGVGKSHVAQALGHAAAREGHDVLLATPAQLLGSLHAARATLIYERRFQALCKIPLLIIDDFLLKPLPPSQEEDLHDLVAARYEKKATLITSNLHPDEWGEAFANRLLGAATIDRLRHNAYVVVLEGASYRTPRTIPPSGTTEPKGQDKQERNRA